MSDGPRHNDTAVDAELRSFGFDSEDAWLSCFRAAEQRGGLGRIAEYDIIEEIGRGGQGVVYRARKAGVEHDLALKRLAGGPYAESHTRQRFEREIRAVSELVHPNIVGVHALEQVDGQPLLAMHWIDGQPIAAWARGRPVEAVLATFSRVCGAVHHAHQRGVIHRDLKPSNILVDRQGEPHVLDFGLARRTDEPGADVRVTATLQFVGTPAYAAPEQLADPDAAVDTRVDVYALGMVLFEMLTGRLPYELKGSLIEVARTVRDVEAPRPSSFNAAVERDLDAIVLKALAKEPQQRYQSVDALADDMRRYNAGEAVVAHPPSRWYRLGKIIKRNPVTAGLTAALCLTVLVGSGVATVLAIATLRAHDQEYRARVVAERIGEFLGDVLSAARPSRGGADMKLLEVLEEASARAEVELVDEPQVAAEVFYRIGDTYRALWRSNDGLPYLERSLSLLREVHPGDHADVARTLTALGTVQTNRRQPQAVDLQREALAMRRRMVGDEHALVAESLMRLGYALHQAPATPAWDEAETHLDAALAMYRRLHGPVHRDVASCLHNIGWMRVRQNRIAEALVSYAEAADIFRKLGDHDDPFYAECLYGYAAQLMKIERYADARETLDEAIPLVRRIYGDGAALPLLWQRSAAAQALGAFADARRAYNQAAVVLCEQLLVDEPDAAETVGTLRLALLAVARDAAPAVPTDDMLAALPELSTKPRQQVVDMLHRCAGLLLAEGHDDRALPLITELRAAHDRFDIPAGAALAAGLEALADHAMATDRFVDAEALLAEALAIGEQRYPDIAWDSARLRSKRGACLMEMGEWVEAETVLRDSRAVLAEAFGETHPLVGAADERLARCQALRSTE